MIRYEGLLLTNPQINQADTEGLESAVNKIVQEKQGTVLSFERWGKYRLAYPVAKNEYGVYFLVRFDIPEKTSTLADLKMLFEAKLNTIVMRNLFTRLSKDQPLAYQRPKSLEETPMREQEDFSARRSQDRERNEVESEEKEIMSSDEQTME